MLHYTILERPDNDKHSSLLRTLVSYEENKCCIHNIEFSLQLMDGPKKLECYIAQSWKGLSMINPVSYRAHL
jgi:hypothetical protein